MLKRETKTESLECFSPTKARKRNCIKSDNKLPSKLEGKDSAEEVRILKQKLKRSDTFSAFVSCFGLVFQWIESEIFFNNENTSTNICITIRISITISCLLLNYYIFNHYKIKLEIEKARKMVYKGIPFVKSADLKIYILESIFCWIHSPPGFDYEFENDELGRHYYTSLDAYCSVIMLGRLYMFVRLFDHYTSWTGERAIRVCKLIGFNPDSKFAIKSYLKYKSVIVLIIIILLLTTLFGLAIRTIERNFQVLEGRKFSFNSLYNSFWCVVVSMFTIGFGDIFPVTQLGRFIIITASIMGGFIQSMFVVTLTNTLQLTKEEVSAYEELTRINNVKSKLEGDASKLITTLFRLNGVIKKKMGVTKKMLLRIDIMMLSKRFRIKRKNVYNQSKSIVGMMNDINDEITIEFAELMEVSETLSNMMNHVENSLLMQENINAKLIKMIENSQKLTTLTTLKKLKQCTKDYSWESVPTLYDYQGNTIDNQ